MSDAEKVPWYAGVHCKRTVLVIAAIVLIVQGVRVVDRVNDFEWHMIKGQELLANGVNDTHYLLPRMAFNAGLSMLPHALARVGCYLLAVVGFAVSIGIWQRLVNQRHPLAAHLKWVPIAISLAMMFALLLRDLDESGLQTLLLIMLSAAAWSWHRGRNAWCGFWLGSAVAFKLTPIIFLPLLVWKREWRAAAWMGAFVLMWNVLPVAMIGWDGTVDSHQRWLSRVRGYEADAVEAYPSLPGTEAPKPQNVSLRALFARYVEHYEPGHPNYFDHPLFFQFADLQPQAAKRVVQLLVGLTALLLAWRMRHKWGDAPPRAEFAPEWAVACLFTALVSPICWKQHLVVAWPTIYVLAHATLANGWRPRRNVVALVVMAAIFLLSRRGIIGHGNDILLLTYKLDTMCLLMAAALVLTLPAAEPEHELS